MSYSVGIGMGIIKARFHYEGMYFVAKFICNSLLKSGKGLHNTGFRVVLRLCGIAQSIARKLGGWEAPSAQSA